MGSGASIPPEAMMHFPLFQISPYFSKDFQTFLKFLVFYSPKFLMTFFPCFSTFPPSLFRENYYFSPSFKNFPSVLEKFTCFLHTLCVFRFPLLWPWCICASPNARTGRPCMGYGVPYIGSIGSTDIKANEALTRNRTNFSYLSRSR